MTPVTDKEQAGILPDSPFYGLKVAFQHLTEKFSENAKVAHANFENARMQDLVLCTGQELHFQASAPVAERPNRIAWRADSCGSSGDRPTTSSNSSRIRIPALSRDDHKGSVVFALDKPCPPEMRAADAEQQANSEQQGKTVQQAGHTSRECP